MSVIEMADISKILGCGLRHGFNWVSKISCNLVHYLDRLCLIETLSVKLCDIMQYYNNLLYIIGHVNTATMYSLTTEPSRTTHNVSPNSRVFNKPHGFIFHSIKLFQQMLILRQL